MCNPVRIFIAGDFCSTPSATPISVSDELREKINSCDFKVCNFEVPLRPDMTLPPQTRRRFYQNDDVPEFLHKMGFNLFSIATNHTFDWGEYGFLKTKKVLGDSAFGAGTYDEALKVKVVEKDGIKIGFLALCFAAYTGVFHDVAKRDGLGCAYVNDLNVNHVIIEAKKIVDYLIVMSHDGIEYVDIPIPETIARYRDFVKYGADIVIGTHPHCPQGWERWGEGKIFYSLGNFYFNSMQDYSYCAWNRPHWYEGLCVIFDLDLEKHNIDFEIINTKNVDNLELIVDHSEKRNEHNERLCNYIKDEVEYKYCYRKQIEKIVEAEYMPKLEFSYKQLMKAVIKKVLNPISIQSGNNNYISKRLLEHDTLRAAIIRYMNHSFNNK